MATTRKILSYEEMLEKFPDWRIFDTDTYYRESTPEATEAARLRVLRYTGIAIKFMQDHGLTRRVLCETAPDIPEDFRVYLRDITPEGLEFDRTGFMKWLDRLDRTMHADPSDVSVMEKALAEMRAKVAPAADPQQCADSKPNIKSRQSSKKPGLIKKYDDMRVMRMIKKQLINCEATLELLRKEYEEKDDQLLALGIKKEVTYRSVDEEEVGSLTARLEALKKEIQEIEEDKSKMAAYNAYTRQ